MNTIFSLRPFSPAPFILYVYLTLHNQFPANLAAADTEPAILGSREVFRYDPASGRAVITAIHADLQGLSNEYDGYGWGHYWSLHFADLNSP